MTAWTYTPGCPVPKLGQVGPALVMLAGISCLSVCGNKGSVHCPRVPPGWYTQQSGADHRMAWVGRDLKDHQAPSPLSQAGPPTSVFNTRAAGCVLLVQDVKPLTCCLFYRRAKGQFLPSLPNVWVPCPTSSPLVLAFISSLSPLLSKQC